MKTLKKLIFTVVVLGSLATASAFADTCYDPRYGYYHCYPAYSSYPDQGQAFVEGAVIGIFLGGFINNESYYHGGRGYYHGHGGHWGGHGHHH